MYLLSLLHSTETDSGEQFDMDAHAVQHQQQQSQHQREDSTPCSSRSSTPPKRLRLACDSCHSAKIRCSGGQPCKKCQNSNLQCKYSYMARLGKPKGSRNKKTLERLNQAAAARAGSPSDAMQHERPKGLDSGSNSMSGTVPQDRASFDVNSHPAVLPTSAWPTLNATYPPMNEEHHLGLCIESGNLRSLLDSESSMPPGSPDPGLLPLQMISPPMDKETHSMLAGYHSYLSPANSDAPNTCDLEGNKSDAEWGYPSTSSSLHRAAMLNDKPHSSPIPKTQLPGAPYRTPELQQDSDDHEANGATCSCLRVLTDQLCQINAVERQQDHLRLDTTFSNTSAVLDNSSGALTCPLCLLDSKVLLLIMTLLQTVINWARQGCQKAMHPNDSPPVTFGEWRVSKEDGNVIRALLVNRVLAKSSSTVEVLRQRIHDVCIMADKSKLPYQMMDAEALQATLQRLVHSMREATQLIKAHGLDA